MEFLKKTFSWTMLLALVCSMSFISCSSDDDEEGGSTGVKKCYIKIDGKQKSFKYAFYAGDEEGDVLLFTDIDFLYYQKNPNKAQEIKTFTYAVLYSSENFVSGTTTDYEFMYVPKQDLDGNYLDDIYISYSQPIQFTVNDEYYKINASDMKMLIIESTEEGEDITGETTAEFYFEGTLEDLTFMLEDDYAVSAVKIDKPTMQWLKSMRTKK